jgi:hypothetical protein
MAHGQVVFRQHIVFVESKKTSYSANKASIEDASRQDSPLLVFERLEKTSADAGRGANFVSGHAAQFSFSLQTVAKPRSTHAIRYSFQISRPY